MFERVAKIENAKNDGNKSNHVFHFIDSIKILPPHRFAYPLGVYRRNVFDLFLVGVQLVGKISLQLHPFVIILVLVL